MTVNQMQYFVTLCREKSFSKAAELLFVTQPAISRQIAALEEELGVSLILRNRGKAFEITPSGKRYFQIFDRFLTEKGNLDYLLKNFELEASRVTFRIGLMAGWYLPEFIAGCNKMVQEQFPDIELQFEFFTPEAMRECIRNQKLDAVIMIDNIYEPTREYSTCYVCDIHSAFFVSSKHPAVQNGKVVTSMIEGPYIALKNMDERRPARFQLGDIINNHKIVIRELNSVESVSQNILAGEGVSLCDEWSHPYYLPEFTAQILPDYLLHIIIAYRNTAEPVLRQIVEGMEELLKKNK